MTFCISCGLSVLGMPVPRTTTRYFAMVGLLFVRLRRRRTGARVVDTLIELPPHDPPHHGPPHHGPPHHGPPHHGPPHPTLSPVGERRSIRRGGARRPCRCPSARRERACRRAPRRGPW